MISLILTLLINNNFCPFPDKGDCKKEKERIEKCIKDCEFSCMMLELICECEVDCRQKGKVHVQRWD